MTRTYPRLPHRDDVLIALAGLVSGLLLWGLGLYDLQPAGTEHGALALIPLGVMCVAALGRRVAQPGVLLLATAALAGDLMTGSLLATVILFTDVLYAAVLYGPRRFARVLTPLSVVLTVAVALGALAVLRRPDALLLGVVCGFVTVAPAWTGAIVRDHRNAASAERLRAEQTALLAEMDRTQAVTAERARMARELHDVVANHLSAIAIHSTAALSLDEGEGEGGGEKRGKAGGEESGAEDEEGRAAIRDALGVIRENSVQGLAEMRRLIGLLRAADGAADGTGQLGAAPSPTLDSLDALLARARDTAAAEGSPGAGLDFALHDERGAGELPVPVGLAAYRVVQEAVTNALKHASPGTVTVELRRAAAGPFSVTVTSPLDGRGRRNGPRAPGSGTGLIGMRERVELLGGDLTAGPGPGPDGARVWRVHAELPVAEPRGTEREREKERERR